MKAYKKIYKLKKEVKNKINVVLLLIVGVFIGISTYQLFTVESIDKTTGASCYGTFPKVCTGTPSQYKRAMDK